MTMILGLLLLALFLALVNLTAWWLGIDIAGIGGMGDDPESAVHGSGGVEHHGSTDRPGGAAPHAPPGAAASHAHGGSSGH